MGNWKVFKEFSSYSEALAYAEFLEKNKVNVRVEKDEPLPGLVKSAQILVPEELEHRVRWVLAQQGEYTDQELSYIATGELGTSEQ